MTAEIDGHTVHTGSLRFIRRATGDARLPAAIEAIMRERAGDTFILVAVDGAIQGLLALQPAADTEAIIDKDPAKSAASSGAIPPK